MVLQWAKRFDSKVAAEYPWQVSKRPYHFERDRECRMPLTFKEKFYCFLGRRAHILVSHIGMVSIK